MFWYTVIMCPWPQIEQFYCYKIDYVSFEPDILVTCSLIPNHTSMSGAGIDEKFIWLLKLFENCLIWGQKHKIMVS